MAHEMSVAETPATTLCARAADGGEGAPNPLDEYGPVHVFGGADRIAAAVEDAALGLTMAECATKRGVTKNVIAGLSWRYGIKFSEGRRGFPPGKARSQANRENCAKGQAARRAKERNSEGCSPRSPNHCTAEQLLHEPLSHGGTL